MSNAYIPSLAERTDSDSTANEAEFSDHLLTTPPKQTGSLGQSGGSGLYRRTHQSEARFWNATERAEGDFIGNPDVVAFRRRMKRLGHPDDVIADRIEAIHPELAPTQDHPA